MLSQKMKSTPSIKIEVDNDHSPTGRSDQYSLYDTPSIAVANCNVQHKNISHKYSPIDTSLLVPVGRVVSQPTTTNKKNSILLSQGRGIESLLNPNRQSTIAD